VEDFKTKQSEESMKATIKELSLQGFNRYGTFADMVGSESFKKGKSAIKFFPDMVQLNLGSGSIASFSVCRVEKRPPLVNVSEYHSYTGEGILPLDGDVCIHVAPAPWPGSPVSAESVEIFRVAKGTLVSLKPGVWHHAPFAMGTECVNVLIVLPERTYANDCIVHKHTDDNLVEF
jgi:ureidoglycolate lyase